jgi:hypothetical protein
MQGVVATLFLGTPYYAAWLVGSLFPIGLYMAARKRWSDVAIISEWLVRLGLFGTVVGLAIAFASVVGRSEISLRDLGAATALHTTIVGLACSLWLDLNQWLLER